MSRSYLIIEARGFTFVVKDYFGSDEAYAEFQAELVIAPERGAVIAGASHLRKLRWGDKRRGMGKRGGLRVIYLHVPDIRVIYLLDVYGKDEADDLTPAERRELQMLAQTLIKELRERYSKEL